MDEPAAAPFECIECQATIFRGVVTPNEIFQQCRRVACPFWKAGNPSSPAWMERTRSYELWKRSQAAEVAERQSEPIPD